MHQLQVLCSSRAEKGHEKARKELDAPCIDRLAFLLLGEMRRSLQFSELLLPYSETVAGLAAEREGGAEQQNEEGALRWMTDRVCRSGDRRHRHLNCNVNTSLFRPERPLGPPNFTVFVPAQRATQPATPTGTAEPANEPATFG